MNNQVTDYYRHDRKELVPLFGEDRKLKVLEIGCGCGNTGAYLKRIGIAKSIVGIELDVNAAHEAEKHFDQVIIGNIEAIQLDNLDADFDAILLADVLEHLKNPWLVMKNLTTILKSKGFIVASIPNVRFWCVTSDLIFRGKWEYVEFGVLDHSHLRFFTKGGIEQLFKDSGLVIEEWSHELFKGKTKVFNCITFGAFKHHFVQQYFIRARKIF